MSAMCSQFDPSLIASSVSPSKETLAILADFLQTFSFPSYQSLRSEVVGFQEFVRHSGSSTGLYKQLRIWHDLALGILSSFQLQGLLVGECWFSLYQL